ncbi:MAG: substrate-binding domain-containing protein [Bacteroidales bacterium]|nr:substrate-binding domain-containing protein [Bacteroidales bacterium]
MNRKITIIDVAKRAGVSKGTVDRVVHNRGEVSKKSEAKVRRAIEELHYEPNLYASVLAMKTDYVIACLLPEFSEGEYWEKIWRGFEAGGEQVSALNVTTRLFSYDQYDVTSFRKACAELLEAAPSGVVMPPLFKSDCIAFTEELRRRDIPYVYVDSKLEDDNYFAYYGMPMYKSGFLCAALLTERLREEVVDQVAVIRINRDKARQSDPTVNRRSGFMDYLAVNFPKCEVYNVFITPSDPKGTYATLDAFFKEHPGVKLVVMMSSRIHLIGKYLADHPIEGGRVIGFDNLEKNIALLQEGLINILITQRTENQSRYAVISLADRLLIGRLPARRDNYMHMDILTRYNQENY